MLGWHPAPDRIRPAREYRDMASRVRITHACGHEGRALDRGTKASAAYLAELAAEDCTSCQRFALYQSAIQVATEIGLPDLEGSDRQVPWAATIRDDIRQRLGRVVDAATARGDADVMDTAAGVNGLLYGITDAGAWIDMRDTDPHALAQQWQRIARAVKAA